MRNKQVYQRTAIICAVLYLVLGIWIRLAARTSGLPLDSTFQHLTWATRTGFGNLFFSFYTNLFGGIGGVLVAIIVFALFATVLHRRKGSLWFASSVIAVLIINFVVKHIVGRVRPDTNRLAAFVNESGASYASGHSAFATILFGCIFFLYYRRMRSISHRRILAALCLIGLLLVLISRVYVGVHYPSDTLGGVLLGAAWLGFSYPYFVEFSRSKRH